MKKLRNILAKPVLALAVLLFSAALHAQELDKATVQHLVQSKNFIFKAQSALPMTGATRQLSYDYEVKFLGDSVISYLPYFGRAYMATYPGGGGLDFTSTKFDYKAKQRKKGGWDIILQPKDATDVREFNLTVYENGYAYLQVLSKPALVLRRSIVQTGHALFFIVLIADNSADRFRCLIFSKNTEMVRGKPFCLAGMGWQES